MTARSNCMIGSERETRSLGSSMSHTLPVKPTDSLPLRCSTDEKRPFSGNTYNSEPPKYKLFPRDKQLLPITAKSFDPSQAYSRTMSQFPAQQDKSEKTGLSHGLLFKIKGHSLARRRKISVPELGHMTTVQELSMDSPTIPGRQAFHERSFSNPVNTLRKNSSIRPTSARVPPRNSGPNVRSGRLNAPKPGTLPARQPLSPKDIAPLAIPHQSRTASSSAQNLSLGRLRSASDSLDQSTRLRPEELPKARSPFTPSTPRSGVSSTTTPRSTTTYMTTPGTSTPSSVSLELHRSPPPYNRPHSGMATTPQSSTGNFSIHKPSPIIHQRSASAFSCGRTEPDPESIMNRGRPLKRVPGTSIRTNHRWAESEISLSCERRVFETLPQGYKLDSAAEKLNQAEITHLRMQALEQAARFEVLKSDDVDDLSRELRYLDERTEYLRHTYTSLRAGRRSLQSRICRYLRARCMARFNYDAVLRQEESLAELDASIDDWAVKLEHSENRRMRVRQKLLEHIAAAASMSETNKPSHGNETPKNVIYTGMQPHIAGALTPPRSPTKDTKFLEPPLASPSPSPQRVVGRIPSAIIEDENEDSKSRRSHLSSSTQSALQRMESIRIYADSDIHALIKDVANGFTELDNGGISSEPLPEKQTRTRGKPKAFNKPPPSPLAPSPPMKDSIFLTPAVFQARQNIINV
ncbi:hypothetical protein F4861DRAFT_533006 [Xylaria intraflava]|nr:hypothetical protein F4861DRAFT_533006 [Xylaria intraflava]